MTIALFLLAAVSPCTAPTLCPTRKQLIQAITAYTEDEIWKMYQQDPKDSNDLVLRVAKRIHGVSDMVCGDALSEAPRSMNCKFTVRYGGGISYEVATLVWRDGEWVITDTHVVWRDR